MSGPAQNIHNIYDPLWEHDACGIGAVVNLKGTPSHATVDSALKIVEKLEHRAGKDATGETGDGVGLMIQVPHKLMVKAASAEGIALGGPRKIEEIFDAFRQIQTPFGSGYLATLAPTDKTALVFGPDADGQYLYFYLSGDGLLGYVGFSPMGITITGTLTQPDFPPARPKDASLAGQLCYHSDIFRMKDWLKESLESYLKTGTPLPFRPLEPAQIYTFRE